MTHAERVAARRAGILRRIATTGRWGVTPSLTEEQRRQARELRAQGLSWQAIADRLGSSASSVKRAALGLVWCWCSRCRRKWAAPERETCSRCR